MKKPITIFEYSDPFAEASNGIENIVNSMVNYSSDNTWIFIGATENINFELGNTYSLISQPNLVFIPVAYKINRPKKRIPNSLRLLFGVFRFRKRIKPLVIHTHRIELGCILGLMWPKSIKVQFIHNEASSLRKFTSSSFWKYFTKAHKLVEQISISRSSRIIVFSMPEHKRLLRYYANNKSIVSATTWFDEEIFYPADITDLSSERSEILKLIWVGRFEKEKYPGFVLDVASTLRKNLSSFEIIMVGEGSLSSTIEYQIQAMNLEKYVKTVGKVNPRILANYYRNSHVYICTSHYEGSPTTLVEALACGLPCVCTVASDPDSQIIEGFNGFRIPEHNAQKFALSILLAKTTRKGFVTQSILKRQKSRALPYLIDISTSI